MDVLSRHTEERGGRGRISNKIICITLIIFLLVQCLCACSDNSTEKPVTPDYLATFIKCMDVSAIDWPCAISYYCHWEDVETKSLMLETTANDIIKNYRIIEHKALSDKLWVIQCSLSNLDRTNVETYKFVGLIEGQYVVMWNVDQIPDELKNDLDLGPYVPPGL